MEEQRRADVVRQVADDAQVGPKRREVEFERVAFVETQFLRRVRLAQPARQVAIDFDCRDMAGARDQAPRDRGQARADFDDVVARPRVDGLLDACNVMRIGEKILAESLAGIMAVHSALALYAARSASSMASSTAAIRLPGSAVRASVASRARSRAVP